jgi:hypothetical protein
MDFTMYVRNEIAHQMHQEKLDEASELRAAWQVSALNRARRRAHRAEQRMSRAHVQASRLRRQLEAEL